MLRLFRLRIFQWILSCIKKRRINQLDDAGNRHGLWRFYYCPGGQLAQIPNGALLREVNYVNGVLHGPCRTWFKNGQLLCEVNMVNGFRHGPSISYRDDGNRIFLGNYMNGTLEGELIEYRY